MASHIQPAQLYTFTASIKNTSSYTQHLHYHTTELLLVRRDGLIFFFFKFATKESSRVQRSPAWARAPPAAWSGRVVGVLFWPSVLIRFSFLSCLVCLVFGLSGRGWGRSRRALLSSRPRHSLWTVLIALAGVLLMSVPLNVIIAHLETQKKDTNFYNQPTFEDGSSSEFLPPTHLLVRRLVLLLLAVVQLAVGQLPQVGVCPRVQLLANVVVVAAIREVVGAVAPRAHQVGVGPPVQQQLDQREVLLIHSQVERAAAVPLLLSDAAERVRDVCMRHGGHGRPA